MSIRLLLLALFLITQLVGDAVARSRPASETRLASDPAPRMPGPEACTASASSLAVSTHVPAKARLTVAAVERASGTRQVSAFVRVLDPLPLIRAVHTVEATRSVLVIARSEYARVGKLHADDLNASTRDLENARAAFERATLDLSDATARRVLAWGSATAQRNDLNVLAGELVAGRSAVARLDLPAGNTVPSPPEVVSLSSVDGDVHCSARLLGPAPTTDPLLQGRAYLFLIERDPPPPGTSLLAELSVDEQSRTGVSVPRSAIVWNDGNPLVYVEVAPSVFERRTVGLHMPLGDAWLVTSGVAAGDRIVLLGAQQLLSEELLAVLPTD